MTKITIDICDEFYEFAKERAEDFDCPGAADYLLGLLNMAVLRDMDEHEAPFNMPPLLPLVILMPEEHQLIKKLGDRGNGVKREKNQPSRQPVWRDEDEDDLAPEFEEDPGGGVWKKGDLDDDIPF